MLIRHLEPLTTGNCPFSMSSIVRDRLPTFTAEQKEMVKGSYDFIGINYYSSTYIKDLPISATDFVVVKYCLSRTIPLLILCSLLSEGVNVHGYFYWSLLDGMEPESGYTIAMGLHYTDYVHQCNRYPKASAKWFKDFMAGSG
ncbi:hypothetical protein HHK36_025136 [Tetracentron sinense]|uniref:Beta-glucosidase n=1 Tax=Tetracentron sinense TaxID=13715 RepID=A0A834YKK0_TETSI|nr:hypothetical protein HHK36_025136 [Tetracentron sinense]